MKDTIINYDESLEQSIIKNAFNNGENADFMLALGSSMRVNPVNHIPIKMHYNGGKMVIVNLQKTPLDAHAEFVIHARIQTVMSKLMERLRIPIPDFKVRKYAEIRLNK